MGHPPTVLIRAAVAVTAFLAAAAEVQAQTVAGRVLDEATDRPISGAVVFLVSPDERGRSQAESDSMGRFFLRVPEPGDYMIVASRIGYDRARTPLLAMRGDALPRIDLLMRPQPIGLERLDVSVDRDAALQRELMLVGVDPRLFPDRRLVTREEVLARQGAIDLAAVLEWQGIPGLGVMRPEDTGAAVAGIRAGPCVHLTRGKRGSGGARCALYVINGTPDRSGTIFWNLPATDVEVMVVMLPTEASTLYGEDGGGGAIVILTRGWVR